MDFPLGNVQSSHSHSSLSIRSSSSALIGVVPSFEAHRPIPPSSSPPVGESSFVSCHVSKLTNLLLPLPPLQQVSPRLRCATIRSSLTCSSLFLPSTSLVLFCVVPRFKPPHPPTPFHSTLSLSSTYTICSLS